jgi:tetratricopeptide (TPR) repeat protein
MTRAARFACFGVAAALLLTSCAASGKKDADEPKGEMTMKTAKRLQKVGELVEDKDWQGALAELDEIAAGKYVNPYEEAKLWEARAGVHLGMNQGMPNDEVVKALEQALALEALGREERLNATYNLAQAYVLLERFSEGADAFARWAKDEENPEPSENFVIASAFFQAKRYDEALPFAKQAVEAEDKAPENWYRLLVQLHYELKQISEAAEVQQQLVAAHPKKENQLELSQLYLDAGDEQKALAALEQLNAKGQLTESKEIVALARLYEQNGAPLKGAALLDKGMREGKIERTEENVEALALCYVAGKDADKAQAALQAAGEDAGSGEVYFQLARLQGQRGKWADARDAVAAAIQKGGVSSPGDAQLLLGIAHYNTKRKDAALASLNAAKRHGPAVAKCADAWIKVVKSGRAGGKASCADSVLEAAAAQK